MSVVKRRRVKVTLRSVNAVRRLLRRRFRSTSLPTLFLLRTAG
jgi:hypothetical protein